MPGDAVEHGGDLVRRGILPPVAKPPLKGQRFRLDGDPEGVRLGTEWIAVLLGLLAVLGLRDKVPFLASRPEVYGFLLLVSLFLSFAMEPAVQWLSRRGMRRGSATAVVFLVGILLMIEETEPQFAKVVQVYDDTPSLQDRTCTTGIVGKDLVTRWAAGGGGQANRTTSSVTATIA